MRSLDDSHSWNRKVGWWLPGAGGGAGLLLNGDRISIVDGDKVLELDRSDVRTAMGVYLMPQIGP